MKQVGILGGTFDPPHLGHLIVAEEVRNKLELDEIWFLPAQKPPHKDKAITDANDRVMMIDKVIEENEAFKLNVIELERLGKSYTFDTMTILKTKYPETRFYFIIGADMVEYLPRWHKINDLLDLVTFVGVNRPGYQLKTMFPIITMNIPMIDISSTIIRDRLLQKKSVRYLIPEGLNTFIEENRLYEN